MFFLSLFAEFIFVESQIFVALFYGMELVDVQLRARLEEMGASPELEASHRCGIQAASHLHSFFQCSGGLIECVESFSRFFKALQFFVSFAFVFFCSRLVFRLA